MTDSWLASDTAFQMFLETVSERDFSEYEFRLWQAAKRNQPRSGRREA